MMAAIYLEHPIHGAKVATMDLEAEMDEKNGWIRYNPITLFEPKAAPVNVLEVKRRRTSASEG
jgi:penicillin-binding protein-related factor A (putative recombinase)